MFKIVDAESYEHLEREVGADIWANLPDCKSKRVFVKPNLVMPPTAFERFTTTRVEVVRLVVQRLIAQGASEIVIGECGFKGRWAETIELSGYSSLISDKVSLVALQDGENFHKFTLVRKEGYLSLYGVKFSDYLLGCDFCVSVPKMKIHVSAGMTGAIKNMMGTITQKGSMHPNNNMKIFHNRLSDFYFLIKDRVQFCLVDGIEACEYADHSGRGVKSGILISGDDPWEVDCAAACFMGFDINEIPYLRIISRRMERSFDSGAVKRRMSFERSLRFAK